MFKILRGQNLNLSIVRNSLVNLIGETFVLSNLRVVIGQRRPRVSHQGVSLGLRKFLVSLGNGRNRRVLEDRSSRRILGFVETFWEYILRRFVGGTIWDF